MTPDPVVDDIFNPKRSSRTSYGKTARLSAVWDFGARISSQSVMFVVSLFLARLLTPADFGITAAARFFITLATRVTQLGLNASLVRMKEIRPEHASSVFVVTLVLGVLAFLSLWGASGFMGKFFDSAALAEVLPLSATVFLIVPFGTVAAAMLSRHLRYRASAIVGWIDTVLGSLISLVLAWFGWGYWSLIAGALAGTVFTTIARIWLSPWRPSLRFSLPAFRETLAFGLGFQAKRLLMFGTTNLDNLIIGRLFGVASLGFYDKGYGLMNQLTERMIFDGALIRIFAVIREEPARFRRALLKGTQATSIVTFPVLIFAAVSADYTVVVLFGQQWQPAIEPFRVLALVGLLRSAARPVSAACEALGLVWLQTGIQALDIAVLVVAIFVGSRWGLTGASAGVLAAAVVAATLNVWLISRHTDVTALDLWRSWWPSLTTALVMALAILAVNLGLRNVSGMVDWGYLLADCAVAAVVYPALLLWTPFESVKDVVRESADDLVPWLRRRFPVGVLKISAPAGQRMDDSSRRQIG